MHVIVESPGCNTIKTVNITDMSEEFATFFWV
jgi:hypothetical protein